MGWRLGRSANGPARGYQQHFTVGGASGNISEHFGPWHRRQAEAGIRTVLTD